jgi:hypothetical protein
MYEHSISHTRCKPAYSCGELFRFHVACTCQSYRRGHGEDTTSKRESKSVQVELPVFDHWGSSCFTICTCQDDEALEWIAKLSLCSSNCTDTLFSVRFFVTEDSS